MTITKRNDGTKGWEGQGIDREDGQEWIVRQMDKDCLKEAGFQLDSGKTSKSKPDCSYESEGASGSELLENARQGSRPLLGKGTPSSPEQTGFRKRRPSGAF